GRQLRLIGSQNIVSAEFQRLVDTFLLALYAQLAVDEIHLVESSYTAVALVDFANSLLDFNRIFDGALGYLPAKVINVFNKFCFSLGNDGLFFVGAGCAFT